MLTLIGQLWEIVIHVILGIVQGVSEILPISSSGHLLFYQSLLHYQAQDNLTFEIMLHFASLMALLIYFRKIILDLFIGFFRFIITRNEKDRRHFDLAMMVVVATIPVVLVGLFLEPLIVGAFSRLYVVGIGFFVTAFVLFYVYKQKMVTEKPLTYRNALFIGLAQCIGVLPGVSRSGMTLSAAKLSKLNINEAKQFVFLLFIPVSLGSFILSLGDMNFEMNSQFFLNGLSMISAFVFTYFALHFLLKKLQYHHYRYFAFYCGIMGLLTMILAFSL
jgi:undecaprenyl-diphosphatase